MPEISTAPPLLPSLPNRAIKSVKRTFDQLHRLNESIANSIGISIGRILQIEIGGIALLAFTMMQIGEHLVAVILCLCFFVFG
jgi:hypothetical protein